MRLKVFRHLTALLLVVAFLGSSVGLPIVTMACPPMQKCATGFSCCDEQTNQAGTNASPLAAYTCCSKTVLAAPLRVESTELKSTYASVQKQRPGLNVPAQAVLSGKLIQNSSSVILHTVAFGPPEQSSLFTLPLRI